MISKKEAAEIAAARLRERAALAAAEKRVVDAAMEWKAGDPRIAGDADACSLYDACAALSRLREGK